MTDYSYIGSELELFREAQNWKAYYSHFLKNYLGSEVLEVGAGIGSTTEVLCRGSQKRWVCLEPDLLLINTLKSSIADRSLPKCCEGRIGKLSDLSCEEKFDSIIYIDVLEHIKNDKAEAKIAADHLRKGGFLVVLAPAHQWLFTPFDKSIGHYRRYNKKTLSAILPETLKCVSLKYLDCVGLMASLANRFILKSKMPNRQQIRFWDKVMVPMSKRIDPFIQYSFGKSVIGIWQKK